MKRIVRTTAPTEFLLALLLSAHVSGQITAPPTKAGGTGVAGRWSGTLAVKKPDGGIQRLPAVLVVQQVGSSIEGSIGESESKQSRIREASSDEHGIRFALGFDGGRSLSFSLRLEGGHLRGQVGGETPNGRMDGELDLTRVESAPAVPSPRGLYEEVAIRDGALFAAFNRRDLKALTGFFAKDLEFYHDKEGLIDYRKNMDSFERHFRSPTKVRRELDPATLEVHPLGEFGAVETGVHRFYSTEPGQAERLTATVKFVHVWRRRDGELRLTRVISYDHR